MWRINNGMADYIDNAHHNLAFDDMAFRLYKG